MRKITLLLWMLVLSVLAFAQSTRTGTVRDEKGDPIPFATVTEVGKNNVVRADANGVFSIRVADGTQLRITASGHQPQTVTVAGNTVSPTLATIQDQLSEVVVTTALNIKRRPRELGYSQTTVNNQTITNGRATNLAQALSGKVAGLNITNTSSSVNAAPRITLRGNRSITGDNTSLIVVDGVPVPSNTINLLNPNDVENVTVLKGGQAATLYGAEGVNGVLVITTKKGSRPQVTYSHTSNFEDIAYLPEFQKTHGSGSGYGATQDENYRPFENQQFGPAFDGSIRAAGRKSPDGRYLELPYQYTPKSREIWDKGYTMQNDVSVSGGDATGGFFLSFQDVATKGIVPKDEYRRDGVRFNARKTYGRFTAGFDGSFILDRAQRTTADFYFFALNTAGWIPLTELKDWRNNYFASPNGYFNDYYNNPWYELDNSRSDQRNNNFNGNLNLNLKATSWLDVTYRLGTGITNNSSKSWRDRYDYSDYAKGLLTDKPITKDPQYNDYSYNYRARNTPITGSVSDNASFGQRINSDLIATLSKDFGDISSKLILGNNLQVRRSKSSNVNATALALPGVFNVGNRASDLQGSESNTEQRRVGNYADLTLGFKDYLFLHTAFRYDQSSVFFKDDRPTNLFSFPYYGADVSFIVTDAVPALKSNALTYLKIRGGYNKNANDNLSPYGLDVTYPAGGGFPFGSTIGATVGNTFPDPLLQPEKVKTLEAGFEAAIIKSRFNIDFSYYKQNVDNQILNIAPSPSTGFTGYQLNTAAVENHGFETEVRGNFFRTKDWSFDMNANYTFNENKVKNLIGAIAGFDQVELNNNGTAGNAHIFAVVGKPFPFLKTTAWTRSPDDKIVIDENDGWPLRDAALRDQGQTIPRHTLGLGGRLSWKTLTLSANAEYRTGYVVYHDIAEDMAFTGSSTITTLYNRQQFIWPNSVYKDASGKYVNNTNIPVEETIANYLGWGDAGFSRGLFGGVGELFATSGAFWKIRDVSLTYGLPQSIISKTKVIKGATLSLFGRNLFTWLPKDNRWTDPEFSDTNGNGVGINTSFNTPPTRQYGATLNVNF